MLHEERRIAPTKNLKKETTTMPNQSTVFSIRAGEWQVLLNSVVLPHTWNSRGAALAGLAVERRRLERYRVTSRPAFSGMFG